MCDVVSAPAPDCNSCCARERGAVRSASGSVPCAGYGTTLFGLNVGAEHKVDCYGSFRESAGELG